jgi:hypothetical protein
MPVLSKWDAWDPILGENLDTREQFKASDGTVSRWRWTASRPDTFLYFRLPKRTGFELRIRLSPATPLRHSERAALRIHGKSIPLSLRMTLDGRVDLVATIPRRFGDRLPALAEVHLNTPEMLDESTLVPYAGTRHLGLAIESISAAPFGPLGELWRRLRGDRWLAWVQPILRRAVLPKLQRLRRFAASTGLRR